MAGIIGSEDLSIMNDVASEALRSGQSPMWQSPPRSRRPTLGFSTSGETRIAGCGANVKVPGIQSAIAAEAAGSLAATPLRTFRRSHASPPPLGALRLAPPLRDDASQNPLPPPAGMPSRV